MIPEDYRPRTAVEEPQVEFSFQTFNAGNVLFLGRFTNKQNRNFSIEELQLLEKIIVALKLKFEKTDIANVFTNSKPHLIQQIKDKNYSYIFLLGEEMHSLFGTSSNSQLEEDGLKFFSTFHPAEMIQNPELKKDAWAGFKSIMESLPR